MDPRQKCRKLKDSKKPFGKLWKTQPITMNAESKRNERRSKCYDTKRKDDTCWKNRKLRMKIFEKNGWRPQEKT